MTTIALEDLDKNRTWTVPVANERIYAILTRTIRGTVVFVDIGVVDDNGIVMIFNDRLCPCKQRPRVIGRSECRACIVKRSARTKAKNRRHKRNRHNRRDLCSTASTSIRS